MHTTIRPVISNKIAVLAREEGIGRPLGPLHPGARNHLNLNDNSQIKKRRIGNDDSQFAFNINDSRRALRALPLSTPHVYHSAYNFLSSITRFALPSLRVIALGGTSRILIPMQMVPRIFASTIFSTSAIF